MRLLVVGEGGREHAISKKLLESPLVDVVYCAPGNPGMKRDGIVPVAIAENDHQALIDFAEKHQIEWTFIGPETPLLAGIVDAFEAAGLIAFGPNQKAALIEGSKDFAKAFMMKYHIPTAAYQTFTDYDEALNYVTEKGTPIVIKADGLAAGKGVVVAEDLEEATLALKDMLLNQKFGASGVKVVIEEFLAGEEFSLLAFVNGEEVYPMVVSQDHKRAYEGDKGPNTGGMGAYSPVPQISQQMIDQALETILKPAAKGMVAEDRSFKGVLYAGLIATSDGAKVIEFNARFGDPETQVILNRMESDLAQVISDLCADKEPDLKWKESGVSLGVVVAAEGYPADYRKGVSLSELTASDEVQLYFAGVTENEAGQLVSKGGRIYLVEATGENIAAAQNKIYRYLNKQNPKDVFYRLDIGAKAIVE